MKLINESKDVKHIKLEGGWKSIKPNEIIETNQIIVDDELVALIEKEEKKPKKVKEFKDIASKKKDDSFKNVPKLAKKTEMQLKQMIKDEINDYSAKIGLCEEVSSSMTKAEMIKTVLKLQ